MWPIRNMREPELAVRARDRYPEAVAEREDELARVDPVGSQDRGDDGRALLVGREELEAHRLRPLAARATESGVACERGLETLVEEHARGRRRVRRRAMTAGVNGVEPVSSAARRRAQSK